ncbi:MAG: hypothetical protein FVQ85_03795 [Planctomycetes bacterium]|nr:hypothetical protein [Planctomycetota bacterium]
MKYHLKSSKTNSVVGVHPDGKIVIRDAFVVGLLIILIFCGSQLQGRDLSNSACIRPYSENRHYWQYKGAPVLLLGGSKTDHIFLLEDLKEHLDEIAGVGGNYVRNTMSQREGLDLKPHKRLSNGKFDLDRWNSVYWSRFSNCLKWCKERDIIIQIEVWDRFDYSQDQWKNSPWCPANNINYTSEQTGLANNYPAPPWRDRQPFFHTVAGMSRYRRQYDIIRQYQERFVAKMLSYSLGYGNVLYCMNNETSTPVKWGQYWMKFIKEAAVEKGVEIYVTDMFDDVWKPQSSGKLKQAFGNPQIYPFIDVSQVNSRSFNQGHWVNIMWIMSQGTKHPRPLNNTKIYSGGETTWGSGTPKDGIERFWRNLIAGSASCRFHRPGAGIGLNDTAKSCIKAARKVESLIKFWDIEPRMELLSNRETDEAYLAAQPGKRYVLYFTDGGSVALNLKPYKSKFKLRWVDVRSGDWGDRTAIIGGKTVTIAAPKKGPWVGVIIKE